MVMGFVEYLYCLLLSAHADNCNDVMSVERTWDTLHLYNSCADHPLKVATLKLFTFNFFIHLLLIQRLITLVLMMI